MMSSLGLSGCAIENVMFVEEPAAAAARTDIIHLGEVRGESGTKWSLEPPGELDAALVEEARRDALSKVPGAQVILNPVVDMETTSIPMGLTTLYTTKVSMEGTVGKEAGMMEGMKTAADHHAEETAAMSDQTAESGEEPAPNTDPAALAKAMVAKENASAEDDAKTDEEEATGEPISLMERKTASDEESNSDTKDEATSADKGMSEQDTAMTEERPETMDGRDAQDMASRMRDEPSPSPRPPFGTPEYAEACGITVDIPDSYGMVYVRPSKTQPVRVMTAAAYLQLLKNRCPESMGGGS